MFNDSRFWVALILFFLSASTSASARGVIRKKNKIIGVVFFLGAVCCSTGLWLTDPRLTDLLRSSMNYSSLFMVFTGAAAGIFPLLLFLPPVTALAISLIFQTPLQSPVTNDEQLLGQMTFYPSEAGTLSLSWNAADDQEVFFTLEGDRCGLLVRSSLPKDAFFFLRNNHVVLAATTAPVSVSNLPSESGNGFYYLYDGYLPDTRFFETSYPAVKYFDKSFFGRRTFFIRNNSLVNIRE